jgi:hypothetical protein
MRGEHDPSGGEREREGRGEHPAGGARHRMPPGALFLVSLDLAELFRLRRRP